jgi:hypothetical protein
MICRNGFYDIWIGDVAADEGNAPELVIRRQQLEPPRIPREVEGDHLTPIIEELADDPRTQATHRTCD